MITESGSLHWRVKHLITADQQQRLGVADIAHLLGVETPQVDEVVATLAVSDTLAEKRLVAHLSGGLAYTDPMQAAVARFHDAFGMPNLIAAPQALPGDRIDLRIGLITEEGVEELREAADNQDVVAVIDAMIDTVVVAHGALVETGEQVKKPRGTTPVARRVNTERLIQAAGDLAYQNERTASALELSYVLSIRAEARQHASTLVHRSLATLAGCGIDPRPFFNEVHRANMSKLGADGRPIHSRGVALDGAPAGKTLKGPNYSPPDLAGLYASLYPED